MATLMEATALLIGGGGGTVFAQAISGWWTGRREDRRTQRDTDLKIEEHRDGLTFELLTAAREEMSALRAEAASLRPLALHVAHLEEALDHLHALLHADGELEQMAAARRAKAFLKRMRPEPGEKRNAVQAEISAARVIDDAKKGQP